MISGKCLVLYNQETLCSKGGDKHFIDLLNKSCVENVKSEVERTLKSRIICSNDLH